MIIYHLKLINKNCCECDFKNRDTYWVSSASGLREFRHIWNRKQEISKCIALFWKGNQSYQYSIFLPDFQEDYFQYPRFDSHQSSGSCSLQRWGKKQIWVKNRLGFKGIQMITFELYYIMNSLKASEAEWTLPAGVNAHTLRSGLRPIGVCDNTTYQEKLKLLTDNKKVQAGLLRAQLPLPYGGSGWGQLQRVTTTWMSGHCDGMSRVSCHNWITGLSLSRGQRGFAGKVIRQRRGLRTGLSWKDYSYPCFIWTQIMLLTECPAKGRWLIGD